MKQIGKKERKKIYEKKSAIYLLVSNQDKQIAVINVEDFGYVLPCGEKDKSDEEIFNDISIEIGHKLINIKLIDEIRIYYSRKLNDEMVYCDIKANIYTARIFGEGNDETIDGHEIVWKRLEALYEKMAIDFQGQILENIMRQVSL